VNAHLVKDMGEFERNYASLTARESEIAAHVRDGMSSKEIADQLGLSLFTVVKHRERIRKKLDISNKGVSLATYLRSHTME
jgi:DNA-binding CsgD family transcriptional regulator